MLQNTNWSGSDTANMHSIYSAKGGNFECCLMHDLNPTDLMDFTTEMTLRVPKAKERESNNLTCASVSLKLTQGPLQAAARFYACARPAWLGVNFSFLKTKSFSNIQVVQ